MAEEQKPAGPHGAPKPPPGMAASPWESEFTGRLRERFGNQIREFSSYVGQNFVVARPEAVVPILEYLKIEEEFDYLEDVTAVHYPKREKQFDLIYIAYSFPPRNERVRIKTELAEGEKMATATVVHATADWLEREVFDMFGIEFEGHPNLKRILLPEEWQGHPLRKDYSIIQQDQQWVRENLGIESGQ